MGRGHLPQMTDDKFDARKAIKDAVGTHSEHMALYVLAELQRGNAEPPARSPELFLEVRRLVDVGLSLMWNECIYLTHS